MASSNDQCATSATSAGSGFGSAWQLLQIDVDQLVFMHAVAEVLAVAGEKAERQFARHAELFAEPAARREHCPLARARMAAAGIRPKPARVVLLRTALLQHDPPVLVHHEDRKGAMEKAFAVDGLFVPEPVARLRSSTRMSCSSDIMVLLAP